MLMPLSVVQSNSVQNLVPVKPKRTDRAMMVQKQKNSPANSKHGKHKHPQTALVLLGQKEPNTSFMKSDAWPPKWS